MLQTGKPLLHIPQFSIPNAPFIRITGAHHPHAIIFAPHHNENEKEIFTQQFLSQTVPVTLALYRHADPD